MSKNETFGERLFWLRFSKRWTQAQLAKRVGVSTSRISEYERDLSEPRLFTAICLSDVLGVSLEYLTTGRTQKSDKPTK